MSRSSSSLRVDAPLPKPVALAGRPESAVDLWLGQQLRQLRKGQGRSLADVAQACGMSLGLLSQIERGLSSASVKTLHQLAREFGVSVNALLRNAEHTEGEDGGRVARAGTHRYIDLREKGIVKEMYTPPACRSMDLCRCTIEPGGSTGNELFVTGQGEQIGVVLKGSLELWVGDRVVLLNEGDSFCYASSTPRRWRNPGSQATEVIWAISNITQAAGDETQRAP
ncbi:HTH-type transcriptional regulator PuuR [Achromobacter deleyi]|uniref:HTH-type transcriptional regulator PuuR n=1 Tax=Achromobacter deleyi TaxID=1353891 RepID=A0A6S6ZPQ5_9BURK|nr:cupin domain-containing protein [Achromobacter deleyi]CAB3690297.1 HTH-type transcriptional regulator PuuR [Achromobacter deleyi]CAB3871128.1 HTH-type transcriptional regulator PuuR [Achromobacter deleyi]CAB3899150.1 HTH-type transcriptional regulator PuuR [Achromobacter deleyi]CAB3900760.1 HTH-type transcriptional regulator PuuR [Achromobacter deleyi]